MPNPRGRHIDAIRTAFVKMTLRSPYDRYNRSATRGENQKSPWIHCRNHCDRPGFATHFRECKFRGFSDFQGL